MQEAGARLRIVEAGAWMTDCASRLPFRFGIVTMRGAPLGVVRALVELEDGGRAEGFASDLLVPKWFEKDPALSVAESWGLLTDGVRAACALACEGRPLDTAFGHWRRMYAERVESWNGDRARRLLLGHGVSLVERALIDAVCRARGLALHEAARAGMLGFDASHFGLEGDLRRVVLERPLGRIALRHTVGLVDPLEAGDEADDPGDGFPVTLAEAIDAQGLTHFKLKVAGEIESDLERLARTAGVIAAHAPGEPVVTLDGNEQYASIAQLGELLDRARSDARTAPLVERIAWIEQPVARARTFDAQSSAGIGALGLPVIIDEADADREALADAAALGYRGVSIKNCKGVFRALASAMRCAASVAEGGVRLFQSSEDLTNLPALALQQDLVTGSALGITHSERNGHHYFAGLGHLPEAERGHVLRAHPDLYRDDPASLRITDGSLSIASLHGVGGYGYAGPVMTERRVAIESWTPEALLKRYAT